MLQLQRLLKCMSHTRLPNQFFLPLLFDAIYSLSSLFQALPTFLTNAFLWLECQLSKPSNPSATIPQAHSQLHNCFIWIHFCSSRLFDSFFLASSVFQLNLEDLLRARHSPGLDAGRKQGATIVSFTHTTIPLTSNTQSQSRYNHDTSHKSFHTQSERSQRRIERRIERRTPQCARLKFFLNLREGLGRRQSNFLNHPASSLIMVTSHRILCTFFAHCSNVLVYLWICMKAA